MPIALLVLNLVASLASAGWAIVAVANPRSMSRSTDVSTGERFYAGLYAARAIPIGLAAGILPFFHSGTVIAWLLSAAATTQFADAGIGAYRANKGMAAGALIGGVIHLASAFATR